jgi:phosphoribosylamine--glycine ligase
MKLLVVGSGGREHAIAWRLAQSGRVQVVYVAPGNGGTARERNVQNVPITNLETLAAFAEREGVAFTVVGPEAPLAGCGSSAPRRPPPSSSRRRTSPRRS